MFCDYDQLPHQGIRSLQPYIPGKSAVEVAQEYGVADVIKLASNENMLGCSPAVLTALGALTPQTIATYPLSGIHPLRTVLAEKYDLSPEQLILGNGSDTLFGLLLTCFALHRDKHMLTHDYAFSTYAIQANTLGIPVVSVPIYNNWTLNTDALIEAANENTALIFLANPNNPTGVEIAQSEIERLLDAISPNTLLVIDEAYVEYTDNPSASTSINLLKKYPNLLITRTFSKIYGLASLRLGYAIGNPRIIALLYRVQLPFVVNYIALTAALAALQDDVFLEKTLRVTQEGKQQLSYGLTQLGLNQLPTQCNFITFDCGEDSLPIYQHLQRHGIIVRPLHPYDMGRFLRVTIGTAEQNERFLAALRLA